MAQEDSQKIPIANCKQPKDSQIYVNLLDVDC